MEHTVKTLHTLMEENGDIGKSISYLKMDVEGSELKIMDQLLETGVLANVKQFGIEMHTSHLIGQEMEIKVPYSNMIGFFQELRNRYKLALVAYNPNLCTAKEHDTFKMNYPYHDLLFVTEKNMK